MAGGIFYSDCVILALTWATQIWRVFNFLTELFGCFGLITNVGKTVILVFPPCPAIGGASVDTYSHMITLEVITHW